MILICFISLRNKFRTRLTGIFDCQSINCHTFCDERFYSRPIANGPIAGVPYHLFLHWYGNAGIYGCV